jgi:hypothetical protein
MEDKSRRKARAEVLKMDDSKSQIRNPKYQIGQATCGSSRFVQFDISDFGFEICYRPFSKFLGC